MKLKLYQIDLDLDDKNVAFMGYKDAEGRIDPSIYKKVFDGEIKGNDLEDAFRIFNIDHPEDYHGRSMSVSDVIETEEGFFYCDTMGFCKITFDSPKADKAEKTIKVVIVKPGEKARITEIPVGLESLQKTVGGNIEPAYYFDNPVCVIVNGESKNNGMPLARAVFSEDGEMIDIICGTFLICGCGESDFTSLTDEQAEYYKNMFLRPEYFVRAGKQIFAIPYDSKEEGKEA